MAHLDTNSPWVLTARDVDLNEIENISGYLRLRMDLKDSDIGQWTIRMMTSHPAFAPMLEEGSGLVVRPVGHHTPVMSGYTTDMFVTESRDSDVGFATFMGVTDTVLLSELAYPDPDSDVSTSGMTTFGDARDTRTGAGETVIKDFVAANIGSSAGISRRRYSFLDIPASQGLGASGSWSGRFHVLRDLCREIARYAGLSFRIVQSGPGELTLEVWEPEERPSVRFSVKAQNLTSGVLTFRAPDSTEVVVGAGGENADREFLRRGDDSLANTWGRRVAKYLDRRSVETVSDAQQAGDTLLLEDAVTAGITLYPVEFPGTLFGVDYDLGDKISAVVGGVEVFEPVRRVRIDHEAGQAPDITPSIGLEEGDGESPEDAPLVRTMLNNLQSVVRS